jgi:hypothetical protein
MCRGGHEGGRSAKGPYAITEPTRKLRRKGRHSRSQQLSLSDPVSSEPVTKITANNADVPQYHRQITITSLRLPE